MLDPLSCNASNQTSFSKKILIPLKALEKKVSLIASKVFKKFVNFFSAFYRICFQAKKSKPKVEEDVKSDPKLPLMKLKSQQTRQLIDKALIEGPLAKSLDLSNCSHISEEEIIKILKACPNLFSISISHCKHLSKEFFSNLPKDLYSLSINNCPAITHLDLTHLTQFESLTLRDCANLNHLDLLNLPPQTTSLHIYDCSSLTDLNLIYLKNLEILTVSRCKKIQEFKLPQSITVLNFYDLNIKDQNFLTLSPNLKDFEFSSCNLLTDNCIDLLPSNLNKLRIGPCEKLTLEGLQKVSSSLNLLIISYWQKNLSYDSVVKLSESVKNILLLDCKGLTSDEVKNLPKNVQV